MVDEGYALWVKVRRQATAETWDESNEGLFTKELPKMGKRSFYEKVFRFVVRF